MEVSLKRLIKRFPPPAHPRFQAVNWENLEKRIGLQYPTSFKEFVSVYGGCVWFDTVSLIYSQARTEAEVDELLETIKNAYSFLDGNMYDDNGKVSLPLYPADGGLLPFVNDYNGGMGFWKTGNKNPEKWPVVYWMRGPIVVLEKMTIAKMISDFLDAKPEMIQIWGDVRLYEPERIRLTETTEPDEKNDPKKKRKK